MDNVEKARQWMTTTEATSFLGVSSKTMARLIRDGILKTHDHPLDRRKKLVSFADITRLKEAADQAAA
ncbi:MAG TPA: helix-turn-helix domain-containing protein [Pyrinomonadaceae bacterium]|jgi:excisionase family DNA binding protein